MSPPIEINNTGCGITSQKAHFVAEAKKARVIIEQDEQTQNIMQDAEAKIESLKEQIYTNNRK